MHHFIRTQVNSQARTCTPVAGVIAVNILFNRRSPQVNLPNGRFVRAKEVVCRISRREVNVILGSALHVGNLHRTGQGRIPLQIQRLLRHGHGNRLHIACQRRNNHIRGTLCSRCIFRCLNQDRAICLIEHGNRQPVNRSPGTVGRRRDHGIPITQIGQYDNRCLRIHAASRLQHHLRCPYLEHREHLLMHLNLHRSDAKILNRGERNHTVASRHPLIINYRDLQRICFLRNRQPSFARHIGCGRPSQVSGYRYIDRPRRITGRSKIQLLILRSYRNLIRREIGCQLADRHGLNGKACRQRHDFQCRCTGFLRNIISDGNLQTFCNFLHRQPLGSRIFGTVCPFHIGINLYNLRLIVGSGKNQFHRSYCHFRGRSCRLVLSARQQCCCTAAGHQVVVISFHRQSIN